MNRITLFATAAAFMGLLGGAIAGAAADAALGERISVYDCGVVIAGSVDAKHPVNFDHLTVSGHDYAVCIVLTTDTNHSALRYLDGTKP
jgi:hypothetical protein